MIISTIIFIIVLSILILVHEFGHFWTAKKLGVKVEEFGLGIPPRAIGKKLGETIYSLNWLPFGGFVRLHGENSDDAITEPDRAFVNKSKKVRVAIVVAGVVMNFFLAVFAFSIVYWVEGIPTETENVRVVEISKDSPAEKAGLKENDIVRYINDEKIVNTDLFISSLSQTDKPSKIIFERNGETSEVEIVPRENPPEGEGALGVTISNIEAYYPSYFLRPFYGIYYGFKEAIFWGFAVIAGFLSIFKSLFAGSAPEGLAGPVGIAVITSQVASFGILPLVNFVGILSVNLAILNIIPFPALDGGRLFFIVLEKIVGKKVLPKLESYVHFAGIVVLLMLILAITFGDFKKLYDSGWNMQRYLESMAP